jgi:nitrogen fixation-related uncharacterized protein
MISACIVDFVLQTLAPPVTFAPTPAPTSESKTRSGGDDDDDFDQALAIGLSVPLAIIAVAVIVYFVWWKNACGLFGKNAPMTEELLVDNDDRA